MSDAWNLLDAKLSVPSDMRTAEFSLLPRDLRERIFYMAAVSRGEILEGFRSEVGAIASGARGLEESRKLLEQMLTDQSYQPLPGQEGTIKDLASMRRIQTSLRTNVQLLQGWGQKTRGLAAQSAVPAWELVRFEGRKAPRDWKERFERAGGEILHGRMVALKMDPVWDELGNQDDDSLGTDYPPFAYGSGMGWLGVTHQAAIALGLIDAAWTPPKPKPVSSPNESLETTPQIATRAIRDALSQHLQGLAEWQGDKLLFTDPNGTRPYAPDKLAELWTREMPAAFHDLPGAGQMQREAVRGWLGDHSAFEDQGGTNAWADLLRAAGRIESPAVDQLWRGMSMGNQDLDAFLRKLDAGIYETRPQFPLESWTSSDAAAATYARSGGQGWSVILSVDKPQAAADFSPLVRSMADEVDKQPTPPLVTESEWVYPTGSRFRVLKYHKDTSTRTVTLRLQELP